MQRARSRTVVPLALAALLCAAAATSQDPAAVELRLVPVGGSVSCLYGQGGNIGVSDGPDGLLVVDSQFEWLAERIDGRLRELSERGPVFLVNTHFHGDHTGGNARLGAGAVVVAHENVRKRLVAGDRRKEPAPPEALPAVTYGDGGLALHWNGEEVRLFHVPSAHTDGDTAVWFTGSKVLHLGDVFFAGRFPYVDVASGGSVAGMIAGVRDVLDRVPADTRIIPGHGEVCGPAELRAYLAMLEEVAGRVREALAAGRSVQEMKELRLLEDYARTWSWSMGADAFLEVLAASLGGE